MERNQTTYRFAGYYINLNMRFNSNFKASVTKKPLIVVIFSHKNKFLKLYNSIS